MPTPSLSVSSPKRSPKDQYIHLLQEMNNIVSAIRSIDEEIKEVEACMISYVREGALIGMTFDCKTMIAMYALCHGQVFGLMKYGCMSEKSSFRNL